MGVLASREEQQNTEDDALTEPYVMSSRASMAAVLDFGFPEEAVTIRAGTSVLTGPCEADCIVTDRPDGGGTKTCHRLPNTRKGTVERYVESTQAKKRCRRAMSGP